MRPLLLNLTKLYFLLWDFAGRIPHRFPQWLPSAIRHLPDYAVLFPWHLWY